MADRSSGNSTDRNGAETATATTGPWTDLFVDLGDFRVFEAIFPANSRMAPHAHRDARFGFVLDGATNEVMEGEELLLSPGAFSWHPAALTHTNRTGAGEARMLLVELTNDVARTLIPQVAEAALPSVNGLRALRQGALNISRELRSRDRARAASVEGLTLDFLARAAMSLDRAAARRVVPPPRPEWIAQARLLIDIHLDERLSLHGLAESVGVTQRELARVFRRHLDMTFESYVHRERLRRAMTMLRGSDQSIAEVALACGFYDQAHLAHSMKREVGITPTRYRAIHRR